MQDNQRILDDLRQTAAQLTPSPAVQEDLVQEMVSHLVRLRSHTPGRSPDWYLRACTFHARLCLQQRRRVRPTPAMAFTVQRVPAPANGGPEPMAVFDEVVAFGLDDRLGERLTPRQREVFDRLLAGRGLREIGRELGISHVAVIKLRNKIARTGQVMLRTAAPRLPEIAVSAPAPGYASS
jgi:DNA-directed RNA polymerase specialized sigma24 family protein